MLTCMLVFLTGVVSTGSFRFVCYFTNTAQNRAGIGMFRPENIDPFLCTHLVYSYAAITGLTIQQSEWNDNTTPWLKGLYDGVLEARIANKQLKILLAIGRDSEDLDVFLEAASNNTSRVAFARNVASYIRSKTFDGAQIEWGNLAPASRLGNHKQQLLLLVKELNQVFKKDFRENDKGPLILAATLPAKKSNIDRTFKINDLVRELDFISIRTVDMVTAADRRVGLSAALLSDPAATGTDKYLSVTWVAKYYVSLGVPKDKITIGIPTFGRTFTLNKPTENNIGSFAIDDGDFGHWTTTVGIMAYFEICDLIRLEGKVVNVPAQKGRYYVKGSQWISYEDIVSVIQKTCFIQKERFGGITFWTLDLDDFTGDSCHQNRFPLITTAVNMMQQPNSSLCKTLNPSEYVRVPTVPTGVETTTPATETETTRESRVVCYFTNWARFRRGRAHYMPESIDPNICTHIVFLFANVKDTTISPFFHDDESEPWREGLFSRVVNVKKEKPQLKVLLSIGNPDGDSKPFEEASKTDENRQMLAKHAVLFLRQRGFDGLEVAWHQPTADFRTPLVNLVKALRQAFEADSLTSKKSRLLLSLAMPSGKKRIDEGYGDQLPDLVKSVDFISVMTYNFHGSWDVATGLNAPLYANPEEHGENRYLNVDWVARYYVSKGVSKTLINIGIPTFGISYTLKEKKYNILGMLINGTGQAGEFTGKPGILAFYEVCDLIHDGAEILFVPSQRVNYAVKDNLWVSYESVESVSEKACYAKSHGFGGVNIWSLDLDDFNGISCEQGIHPLISTVYNIMHNIEHYKCSNNTHHISIPEATASVQSNNIMQVHIWLLWSVFQFFIT